MESDESDLLDLDDTQNGVINSSGNVSLSHSHNISERTSPTPLLGDISPDCGLRVDGRHNPERVSICQLFLFASFKCHCQCYYNY